MKKPLRLLLLAACLWPLALPASPEGPRIVTLGGAATEIVFALGAGGHVVGRDQSSLHPPAALELPETGYVRNIPAEGVLALRPDLIVATSDLGPPPAVQQLRGSGVEMVVVDAPESPETLVAAIREVGATLGREERAAGLVDAITGTLDELESFERAPRVVLFMKTPGPGGTMAAGRGTKADAMIELAGGENVVTSHRGYKALSREALLVLDPEVILVAVAENDPGGADAVAAIRDTAAWREVDAVAEGRVHQVPLGKTLGFGPRMAEAALALNGHFAAAVE